MYHADDLNKYRYFRDDLRDLPIAAVVDSLTGLVSRTYILSFIRDLMEHGTPFTLAMIDLDNFKSINDNYGHAIGDRVLSQVAEDVVNYVGNRGLVGRYGGDEFLMVLFLGNDYDVIHEFYDQMYIQPVFRHTLQLDELKLFISGTIGSACFPKDAQIYETLFGLIDKTLYRGKSKGRNCYIIYVKAKHEHLEITKLARRSLYDALSLIFAAFDAGGTLLERLNRSFRPIREYLCLYHLLYLDASQHLTNVQTGEDLGIIEDVGACIPARLHVLSDLQEVQQNWPKLFSILGGFEQGSVMIHAIGEPGPGRECLLFCPEPRTLHIWQDEECATALILAQLTQRLLENGQGSESD